MALDSSNLETLADGFVSHYCWRDADELLAWTERDSEKAFHVYHRDGTVERADGTVPEDGHCSFGPDREWLLVDGHPGSGGTARRQAVYLYHWETGELIDPKSFDTPAPHDSSLRCDLHPRWDRSGDAVRIDSTHRRTRQPYVLDVGELTN